MVILYNFMPIPDLSLVPSTQLIHLIVIFVTSYDRSVALMYSTGQKGLHAP